jgi:hypothetical protein
MSTELLERTIQNDVNASEEQLADDIYALVRRFLEEGGDRDEAYDALQTFYADLKQRGSSKARRAVGEVIAAFDGWCAPSARM